MCVGCGNRARLAIHGGIEATLAAPTTAKVAASEAMKASPRAPDSSSGSQIHLSAAARISAGHPMRSAVKMARVVCFILRFEGGLNCRLLRIGFQRAAHAGRRRGSAMVFGRCAL
jgi:hypothetical protein